jgi:hypothetical protein
VTCVFSRIKSTYVDLTLSNYFSQAEDLSEAFDRSTNQSMISGWGMPMQFIFFQIAFFLFFFAFAIQVGKRRKVRRARQARWLADYRKSPESHLLHLND